MDASLEEIKDYVTYQVGAIQAFAVAQGLQLQHVKPHGALYTMAVQNPEIWDAVAEAVAALDNNLILFVLAGSNRSDLEAIGAKHGIRIGFEFFGDRAYNRDGSLVSRKRPGAVIHDHQVVAAKVLKMVTEGKVICKDGSEIDMVAVLRELGALDQLDRFIPPITISPLKMADASTRLVRTARARATAGKDKNK